MKSEKGMLMVAVLIASVAALILVLFTTATLGQEEGVEKAAKSVSTGALIACVIVGWIGNVVHRIKKVIKKETDVAIITYLRNHKVVFIVGLAVAAVAVLAESMSLVTDVHSLVLSALLTGYAADSIFEAKDTA